MRKVMFGLLAFALAAACFHGDLRQALAASPRLQVTLDEADAAEAVRELSKRSGQDVALFTDLYPPGAQAPNVPGLQERYTFTWNNISFARALRQICQKFHLAPSRRQVGGWVLYPENFGPGNVKAGPRVGLAEKNGFRVYARGVAINSNRSVRFVDGQDFDNSSMTIDVGLELPDEDGGAIAGIERVTAKDDQGNFLTAEQNQHFYHGSPWGQYPDEWNGAVNLSGPHPRAKKLLWLEGDVIRYKIYRPFRVDIPLPLPPSGTFRKEVSGVVVEIKKFQPQPATPKGDPNALPMPGARIEAEIYLPNGGKITSEQGNGWGVLPILVTKSGKAIGFQNSNSNGQGDERGSKTILSGEYQATAEEVSHLRIGLVEKSQPEKLFTFRMQDIPLPDPNAFIPRRQAAPPPPPITSDPAEDTNRAYYEKGGGALKLRVLREQQAAGEGVLSTGLSIKENGDWSAVRWLEVPIGQDGLGVLPDLKPGAYRLLRTFRPNEASKADKPGRWLNGEVTITVAAGKETVPAPLVWTTQPEAPPKKPAPTPVRQPVRRR